MTTTALVVEIIIIGFQTLIWLSFMILIFFGHEWINIDRLENWATPLGLAVVAISYTTGLIFDRIVEAILAPWSPVKWSIYEIEDSGYPTPFRMIVLITKTSPDMATELRIQSNQTKLARATAINLFLISVSMCILYVNHYGFSGKWLGIIGGLLIFFALLAFWTWIRSSAGYYRMLTDAYDMLNLPKAQ